jgi:hypothetical protein
MRSELVPRQPVGGLGPLNEISGNAPAASPEGSPFTPALSIQSPAIVELVIGANRREKLTLAWLSSAAVTM